MKTITKLIFYQRFTKRAIIKNFILEIPETIRAKSPGAFVDKGGGEIYNIRDSDSAPDD